MDLSGKCGKQIISLHLGTMGIILWCDLLCAIESNFGLIRNCSKYVIKKFSKCMG